jgi:hypothetical protein
MKKIITTICIASSLLTLSTSSSAQIMYSETLKQASFALSEGVYYGYNPTFDELFTGVDLKKSVAGIQVTWKISGRNNVSHFEIQKSTNKKQFTTIGSVLASEKQEYSFTDLEPQSTTAYFRVKSIDRDGTITYSNVISTKGDQPSTLLIAYPMPAKSEITVQHSLVADKGLISVHTQDGSLVMSVPSCAGTMQTTMDLSYLKAGTYVLRFETGSGKVDTLHIVKQ